MAQVEQDIDTGDHLEPALQRVREFFAAAEDLTPDQLVALSREQRRTKSRLSTDPDFLQAVCAGSWSPVHADAARLIRAEARSRAAALVAWPRRAALATALEETALVVLNEADPNHPLQETLCARLRGPWDRAVGRLLPEQGPATA
ncbi:MAG: hypothetical protein LH469_02715 [Frankiaceae bacterium]|nr:hypothetical protein [Frankiaceae bacterium]